MPIIKTMRVSQLGHTPALESLGLTREAKALGQDPSLPYQHQRAFEAYQKGRYQDRYYLFFTVMLLHDSGPV